MAVTTNEDLSIQVRVPRQLKKSVQEAATALGQTVNEFATTTVLREAQRVLDEARLTRLSNRDRDKFLAALNSIDSKPNSALQRAARRYRKVNS